MIDFAAQHWRQLTTAPPLANGGHFARNGLKQQGSSPVPLPPLTQSVETVEKG